MRSLGHSLMQLFVLVCVLTALVYFGPQATIWLRLRIDGGYTEWTPWGQCSVSCGIDGAIETRVRTCTNPAPNWLGYDCLTLGMDIEQRQCAQFVPCPVDGGFSDWQSWTACDKTCEGGRRNRVRFCNKPMPMYGGKSCDGLDTDWEPCNDAVKCPVHGGFSGWSQYSDCTVVCKRTRFRLCDNPVPAHGGNGCVGPSSEELACTDGHCKLDGDFSAWAYGECSVTCGKGELTRTRFCNNPAPKNGGKPCEGPDKEKVECTKPECPVSTVLVSSQPASQVVAS